MPDPEWWHLLWPEPDRVILAMGLQPGMRVVDLCCGDGYFTAPLAQRVEPGRVIAIDLEPLLLQQARHRCRDHYNCYFLQADAQELARLVEEPVDYVLIANTFHGVPDQEGMARNVHRILRPGGCFAVINWHAQPREQCIVLGTPRGPATALRLSPARLRQIVEPAGFGTPRQVELPPYHYGMLFRKEENLPHTPAEGAASAVGQPSADER
ncbi:MAG: class I SAM-dependent methyltransferase [Magnetococcales bacterium]|nr:class I SAM-dependent methyltransferase [Magnetococcales bacterium]